MACRFPGARNPDQYWENLVAGRVSIKEVPPSRWRWQDDGTDSQSQQRSSYCRWGGFIDDVDAFDASFFNVSAREAESMDPQQRLSLEVAWACFEDAGVRPSQLSGQNVGVFLGFTNLDYKEIMELSPIDVYYATGTLSSVIPNRISYHFNLHGPSVAVDTACSSSLHAIHLACRALRDNECEVALTGGISLLLTPKRFIWYGKAGILSPTGTLRTFDENADGTVRGEGAGFILLKPLARAIADGNRIIGLIKGSAVNHGGKNPTLTYPSANAQARVIVDALQAADVKPSAVSYVEAHGTGTVKGDPIEVQGLVHAFQAASDAVQTRNGSIPWCGLGSVKPNIGHLEGAAGIAGVIKVLLAFQHKTLPPLVNFTEVNSRISLGSAFYFVDKLQAWESCGAPRLAGVSSFGFAGTNAHVVMAEAPATEQRPTSSPRTVSVVVLSARESERLKEHARQLRQAIARQELSDRDLEEVAFTLQVGREAMQHRMAMTVSSMKDLEVKLEQFVEGKSGIDGLCLGEVQGDSEALRSSGEKELREVIAKSRQEADWSKLLQGWVEGTEFDWKLLYEDPKPRPFSLPTYPFARERYWISRPVESFSDPSRCPRLHSLVHQNTSDLSEQRFSSVFTGQEFFLADHRIQGKRVLPAVAYLEMVREAVTRAVARSDNGTEPQARIIAVKNMIWLRPVVVTEPVEVHIGLRPTERGEVEFAVYSGSSAEEIVYAQGVALTGTTVEAPRLDVEALATRYQKSSYPAKACYAAFAGLGIEYGDGHRGIEGLHVEDDEVLARLALRTLNSTHDFVLHPGMSDSGLQAIIGFVLASGTMNVQRSPFVPFELRKAEFYGSCAPRMWAVVRRDSRTSGGSAEYYDIDLADETGRVCVRLNGLSIRSIENELGRFSHYPVGTRPGGGPDNQLIRAAAANTGTTQTRTTHRIRRRSRFSSALPEASPRTRSAEPITINGISAMWAQVRRVGGEYDIDLCDAYGRGSVYFRRWNARLGQGESEDVLSVEASVAGEVILTPAWEPFSVDRDAHHQALTTGCIAVIGGTNDERLGIQPFYPDAKYVEVDPCESIDSILPKIIALGEIEHVVWVVPRHLPETLADDSIITEQPRGVLLGFHLVKAMLAAGYGDKTLTWTVVTTEVEAVHSQEQTNPTHASVHGLMGSVANEYASWIVRLIDLPESGNWPWEDVFAVQASPYRNALVYREGCWYRQRLLPYRLVNDLSTTFSAGEVCVIIGGHGGIGSAWSEVLLRRSRVQLVWIGRRTMDDTLQSQLDRLAELGPAPVYISADATDRQQLDRARSTILQRFGRIDGLVHAAMVLQDHSLANMTEDVFEAALRPKIDVCVRLAQVFGKDALRFVLFFSSCNAFIKSAGQSNYVAGCTFKDSFARRMASEWPSRVRIINWGYWGTVGAATSERYQSLMARKGLGSIELPGATRIVDELLCGRVVQMAYLRTTQHSALQGFDVRSDEWATSFRETLPSCLPAIERVREEIDETEWSPAPDCRPGAGELDATVLDLLSVHSEPVVRFCNETLARATVQYIEERRRRDPHCELRILEIGAETDGITETVLQAIGPYATCLREYACTERSMPLVSAVRRSAYSNRSFVTHQTFDVERAPEAQGIALDSYDVVIAGSVLHATKDMRRALRNAKAVLKTNGLLMLHELAANTTLNDLTIGLLDARWQFADSEIRTADGPALMPGVWKTVLQQEGFSSVLFLAEKAHDYGHQVIVAESDGVIRQYLARPSFLEDQGDEPHNKNNNEEPGYVAEARATGAGRPATLDEIMTRPRNVAIEHLLSAFRLHTARALGVDVAALDSESRPFADVLLGELGIDSLSSSDLRSTLRQELGVDIPVQRILGEKVHILVNALYDELLIRRVSNVGVPEISEERETYVF
jgi:acyl transferase domain-containing protein/SAM-dependent methyltransferase/acyl carrier protein